MDGGSQNTAHFLLASRCHIPNSRYIARRGYEEGQNLKKKLENDPNPFPHASGEF